MKESRPPSQLPQSDYDVIEAAFRETSRGRWFLDEYTQRNRSSETQVLLDAIGKLESAVLSPKSGREMSVVRRDLSEMSEAILRMHQEIAAIQTDEDDNNQIVAATHELGSIIEATEKATSDILAAAEDIQEVAWKLRENGTEEAQCEQIDARTTDIFMACSFQDVTGQRTGKVIQLLRYLEARVNALLDMCGDGDGSAIIDQPSPLEDARPDAHLLNGPQPEGVALDQGDIDDMLGDFEPIAPEISAETVADPAAGAVAVADSPDIAFDEAAAATHQPDVDPAPEPAIGAESPLDRLNQVQKTALFS